MIREGGTDLDKVFDAGGDWSYYKAALSGAVLSVRKLGLCASVACPGRTSGVVAAGSAVTDGLRPLRGGGAATVKGIRHVR